MEGSVRLHIEDPAPAFDLDALLRVPAASLMVLAPHPDDESLAAGGLIQRAHAHGARVSVVCVTDGENNPWPQRALERRVWIGSRQRVAWGARRRAEADAALRLLDVEPAHVHRLGWPDGGITAMLVDAFAPMRAALRALLEREQPTLLVLPDLADHHPDHAALHVVVELLLRELPSARRPICLGYLLHGRKCASGARIAAMELAARELDCKRRAIAAHASQIALSRQRFMRFAARQESFAIACKDEVAATTQLPWRPPRALRPLLTLLVVDAEGGVLLQLDGRDGGLRWRDRSPAAALPRSMTAPCYAKLFCRAPSPWVFDGWGWCRLDAPSA